MNKEKFPNMPKNIKSTPIIPNNHMFFSVVLLSFGFVKFVSGIGETLDAEEVSFKSFWKSISRAMVVAIQKIKRSFMHKTDPFCAHANPIF